MFLILAVAGCRQDSEPAPDRARGAATEAGAPRPAPDFTLETPDGEVFALTEQRGNVVVVNFWATWCPPCVVEIPEFVELQEELADQGVVFVGVSQDTGPEMYVDIRDFGEMFSVNFPLVADPNLAVGRLYNAHSLPTTYVIDREGNIRTHQIGLLSRRDLLNMMEGMIEPPRGGAAARVGEPRSLSRRTLPSASTLDEPDDMPAAEPTAVSAREAGALYRAGAMVVDLRREDERAATDRIPYSLELTDGEFDVTMLPANFAVPVVFVATDEADAWLVATIATDYGYAFAHPLAGGFRAWAAAGLPLGESEPLDEDGWTPEDHWEVEDDVPSRRNDVTVG
jgi:peroxiredoxin/rhodanese-related sulfurtransferase